MLMIVSFSKILVPVDFTINTEVAMRKALDLCDKPNAAIHLLHISRISETNVVQLFNGELSGISSVKDKMDNLRSFILTIRKDISVFVWMIASATIEQSIVEKAKEIEPDLIIIGKNSHHTWMPFLNSVVPGRIAKKTGLTVLTVKPGSIGHDIRTVVVPIGKQFDDNKIAVIRALRKKFRINIRLITFIDDHENDTTLPGALIHVYRALKTNPATNVSYDVLKEKNKTKAILRYCEKVNADLLIINSQTETRAGWLNKHISDVLPKRSKTQILAV
jgi:nucleotide-binding universal stress UspA family protein